MQADFNNISDLLVNDTFISYCFQKNQEDVDFWNKYLETYPDKRAFIEKAKSELMQISAGAGMAEREVQLQQLQNMVVAYNRGNNDTPGEKRGIVSYFTTAYSRRFRYAAIIILVAGLGIGSLVMYNVFNKTKATPTYLANYTTKEGERKSVQLPDGSIIKLNNVTQIELDEGFGRTNRTLRLTGEAYFDVVKNPDIPFIVKTNVMDIRVKGTIFNVKVYPFQQQSEATVIKGLVEVHPLYLNSTVVQLKPSEKYILLNEGIKTKPDTTVRQNESGVLAIKKSLMPKDRKTSVSTTYSDGEPIIVETAWTQDKLSFYDEPLEQIAEKLSQWYGVKITIQSNEVKQYSFTATYSTQTLEMVLNTLQTSRPFKYKKTDDGSFVLYK